MEAKKIIVTAQRIPASFNPVRQYVVEADSEQTAIQVVRIELYDTAGLEKYEYATREFDVTDEINGRIVSRMI